jgi:hypothetical protein
MDHNVTALERAFQIAKSGDCKSVAELKKQLRKERYSIDKITGRTLCRQLEALGFVSIHNQGQATRAIGYIYRGRV